MLSSKWKGFSVMLSLLFWWNCFSWHLINWCCYCSWSTSSSCAIFRTSHDSTSLIPRYYCQCPSSSFCSYCCCCYCYLPGAGSFPVCWSAPTPSGCPVDNLRSFLKSPQDIQQSWHVPDSVWCLVWSRHLLLRSQSCSQHCQNLCISRLEHFCFRFWTAKCS